MTHEIQERTYRGVLCMSCRQPIPLPEMLANMDTEFRNQAPGVSLEHPTRVFKLRCRACYREKPYLASEIMDFEGEPRAAVSRPRVSHVFGQAPRERSRAANG
jgi:hypothetical protein